MTEQEFNRPTRYFLIIVSIVAVAVLGYLLFGLGEPPEEEIATVEYNYFTFKEIGGMWNTNINFNNQLYGATFRFNPEQVEEVYVAGNFTGFRKSPVYITFDPDVDEEQFKYLALAASELSLHLIRALNVSIEVACTKNETDACIDRPIVTCQDDESVIYLVPLPPAQITLDDSCITLNGGEMDLLKSVDRMLFQWYKIIR